MKHYVLFVIIVFLFGFNASKLNAQKKDRYPLSDAIHYFTQDSIEKVKVLKAYFDNSNALDQNKFIDASGLNFNGPSNIMPLEVISSQSGTNGNPLGTPLIDALGTVIAKRFKEELTLAFLENFKEKLKTQPYLGELFPNAKLILLYDDPFNHKVWLSSFRGALDEDLRALPNNIPSLLEEIKLRVVDLTSDQKRLIEILLAGYTPVRQLFEKPEHSFLASSTLLENLSQIEFQNKKLSSSLVLMNVLIKEMGNATYDNWANDEAISRLKNPEVARIFIGLTIEKYKDKLRLVKFKNGVADTNLYSFLNNTHATVISPVRAYISIVVDEVEALSEAVNNLQLLKEDKALKGEQLVFSDFLPLIDQSLKSLKLVLDDTVIESIGLNIDNLSSIISTIETSSKFINSIYKSIDNKEYSKIVVSALAFISENIPEDKLESSAALKEFAKYSSFAVNLAGAETSEEMTAAIESGILPVQSYRLKRNNSFSISVNSFAGIFVANEYLLNDDAKNETSGVIGFTAPVGVAFNFGFNTRKIENGLIAKENKKIIGSISIYASLLDVGAITTYRLTNDEDPIEGVEWQNVFSPGLYLVIGIQNTPLALSIGGQYGPELRSVEANEGIGTPTIESRAFRLGLSLTVDIPLLHLYSKKNKNNF
ncbi:hypothetical protein [uncultured Psychroserpens sp.]|uniref:hypothetical protein n=1 Tax=uncultured Psychroserpens sp. TaxID=255436 RepID=UPI002622BE1B|nr:hypothetical protein [uncultured Psychroserpens sp.]